MLGVVYTLGLPASTPGACAPPCGRTRDARAAGDHFVTEPPPLPPPPVIIPDGDFQLLTKAG